MNQRAIEIGAKALRNLAGMTTLDINDAQIREAVRTVLSALAAEGLAVVPANATANMLDKGEMEIAMNCQRVMTAEEKASYVYRAMIQAAQGGDDANH